MECAPLPPLRPEQDPIMEPPTPQLEEVPTEQPDIGGPKEIPDMDVTNVPPVRIPINPNKKAPVNYLH